MMYDRVHEREISTTATTTTATTNTSLPEVGVKPSIHDRVETGRYHGKNVGHSKCHQEVLEHEDRVVEVS